MSAATASPNAARGAADGLTSGGPGEGAGGAWLRHMRRGAWADAWAVSDAVLAARGASTCWHLPRHEQWVWDGRSLAGRRVLVRCYHGLGDTLQFARFVPPLRAGVLSGTPPAEVTLWAQPALLPLLATMRGVGPLAPLHDGAPDVDYDADVEVMELAHVARVAPATLPPPPTFDVAPAADVRAPGDRRLAVGVAWAGGGWDPRRTVPFALFRALGEVPGVALHVLQRGPALADRDAGFGVVSGDDDVLRAARVVRALDLVVTVDSMPAHLAASLGTPVWTLLPHEPDWRWGEAGERTPWYPAMRLFRQDAPGDWGPVIARVADELARLAAGRA